MQYTHNDSILIMKKIYLDEITVTYRLFESECDYCANYSALVSLQDKNGAEDDYFIPNFASSSLGATVLFEKLCKNAVLPCEVEEIYSDGFAEIL